MSVDTKTEEEIEECGEDNEEELQSEDEIQELQLDVDLKDKIKILNNNINNERDINDLINISKYYIITNKCSFDQCIDKLSEYFNKDLNATKKYVEYLCQRTNINLQSKNNQLMSIVNVPKPIIPPSAIMLIKKKRQRNKQNEENRENYKYKNNNKKPYIKSLILKKKSVYYQGNYNNQNIYPINRVPLRYNINMPYPIRTVNYGIDYNIMNNPRSQIFQKDAFKVRCKNWPKCNNIFCRFFHPTELCQYFPSCVYGDKCIYIHPMISCKYGDHCKRIHCNYSHPKK